MKVTTIDRLMLMPFNDMQSVKEGYLEEWDCYNLNNNSSFTHAGFLKIFFNNIFMHDDLTPIKFKKLLSSEKFKSIFHKTNNKLEINKEDIHSDVVITPYVRDNIILKMLKSPKYANLDDEIHYTRAFKVGFVAYDFPESDKVVDNRVITSWNSFKNLILFEKDFNMLDIVNAAMTYHNTDYCNSFVRVICFVYYVYFKDCHDDVHALDVFSVLQNYYNIKYNNLNAIITKNSDEQKIKYDFLRIDGTDIMNRRYISFNMSILKQNMSFLVDYITFYEKEFKSDPAKAADFTKYIKSLILRNLINLYFYGKACEDKMDSYTKTTLAHLKDIINRYKDKSSLFNIDIFDTFIHMADLLYVKDNSKSSYAVSYRSNYYTHISDCDALLSIYNKLLDLFEQNNNIFQIFISEYGIHHSDSFFTKFYVYTKSEYGIHHSDSFFTKFYVYTKVMPMEVLDKIINRISKLYAKKINNSRFNKNDIDNFCFFIMSILSCRDAAYDLRSKDIVLKYLYPYLNEKNGTKILELVLSN